MKRIFFAMITIILFVQTTNAQLRTEKELYQEALTFFNNSNNRRRAASISQAELSIVKETSRLAIVKNGELGFVVLSKDKNTSTVMGYSDSAYTDDCPPAFICWLEGVNATIEKGAASTHPRRASGQFKSSVEPLIKTQWNQAEPYNNMCPMYTDSNGDERRSVTGCVPTALAQIMNYYQWPQHGYGQLTYDVAQGDGSKREISLDFEKVHFDWNNMLPSYYNYWYAPNGQEYNKEQADAVANLMFACGVATKVEYTSGQSGAWYLLDDAIQYIDYKVIVQVVRDAVNDDYWTNLLYYYLSRSMPIDYNGRPMSDNPGHAYIVDGYDEDGLFHLNWGWGGSLDGYYNINDFGIYTESPVMQVIAPSYYPEERNDITIELSAPGTLSEHLSIQSYTYTDNLKISGPMNGTDIKCLRKITRPVFNQPCFYANKLDLSDASIVEGGESYYFNGIDSLYTVKDELPVDFMWNTSVTDHYKSISLPKNLKSIGESTYIGPLIDKIPDSVEEIKRFGITGMPNVHIPAKCKKIEDFAFSCRSTNFITVDKDNPIYDSRDNCNALIETATNTLVIGTPNTVFPKGLEVIGSCSMETYSPEALIIPDGIKTVKDLAFRETKSKSLYIGKDVENLWASAFEYGQYLEKIEVDKQNPYYDSREDCNAIIQYRPWFGTTEIIRGCINTTIPESVTDIDSGAFSWVFNNMSYNLVIPDNITHIWEAYDHNNGIRTVTLPPSIQRLYWSFYMCDSIVAVTVCGEKPCECDDESFSNAVYEKATLYVPLGTKLLYANAKGWKNFEHIQEIDVTSIRETNADNKQNNDEVYFSLDGHRLSHPNKGINIIRKRDGSHKKILVR